MRATLPYGMWTCADGRQPLFNCHYDPIWQRYPGQPATDPDEWVLWQDEEWFFNDRDLPWWPGRANAKARSRCRDILVSWGLDPEPWRARGPRGIGLYRTEKQEDADAENPNKTGL
jgi:hypothetical protein